MVPFEYRFFTKDDGTSFWFVSPDDRTTIFFKLWYLPAEHIIRMQTVDPQEPKFILHSM